MLRALACIGDIDRALARNRLTLKPAQSEFLWSATVRRLRLVDSSILHFGNGDVTRSTTVRNLGAFFNPAGP